MTTTGRRGSIVVVAAAAGGAFGATTEEEKENYQVRAYECDAELQELINGKDRLQRMQGSLVRICFAPEHDTAQAGIGITNILIFVWRTQYYHASSSSSSSGRDGENNNNDRDRDDDGSYFSMLTHEAVRNGAGDGILSAVSCEEDGSICVLQSMLPTKMYIDTGSIYGDGYVTLNDEAGTVVPVKRDMFLHHTAEEYFGGQSPGRCINDTIAMLQSNPYLNDATDKYQEAELRQVQHVSGSSSSSSSNSTSSTSMELSYHEGQFVDEVGIGSTLSIGVPSEDMAAYKTTCTDAGGIATELPDTVVACPFFNQISLFQMLNGVSCLASTPECNVLDIFDVLMDAFAVLGFSNCKKMSGTDNTPTEATPPPPATTTVPPTNPPTLEIVIDLGGNEDVVVDIGASSSDGGLSLASSNTTNATTVKVTVLTVTKTRSNKGAVAGAVIGTVLLVAIIVGWRLSCPDPCCCCCFRRGGDGNDGSNTNDVENPSRRGWIRSRRGRPSRISSLSARLSSSEVAALAASTAAADTTKAKTTTAMMLLLLHADTAPEPTYSDNIYIPRPASTNDDDDDDEKNDEHHHRNNDPSPSIKFALPKLTIPPLPTVNLFTRTGPKSKTNDDGNSDTYDDPRLYNTSDDDNNDSDDDARIYNTAGIIQHSKMKKEACDNIARIYDTPNTLHRSKKKKEAEC